ncbi:MAG: response regulator [Actinomycetota bacterium]|nr:response regulator [Actinomycetota bacterium]
MAALICDDDARLRALYRQEFEWAGVEVVEAGDGEQCLELAVREQPELIVLDLAMPKRGGLSTLPELRRQCPRSVVLVVTAHAAVEVLNLSRELGAVACFSKPGFLARIPEVVERYLGGGTDPAGGVLASGDASAG